MDNCMLDTTQGKLSWKRHSKWSKEVHCCCDTESWPCKAIEGDVGVVKQCLNKQTVCLNENQFYESKRNDCLADFVWKVDLCGNNMFDWYIDIQEHEMRNGIKYLIGIVYVYDIINDNAFVFYAQKYEGDDDVDEIRFYNEMREIKKNIHEMIEGIVDDDNIINHYNTQTGTDTKDKNRIPLLYHLMTNNNISDYELHSSHNHHHSKYSTNTYEQINENNIKHIILPKQHIFHNQYRPNGNATESNHSSSHCNISITLFSPNRNTITYDIPSITIPSKIILTSLVINNISSSSQTLPILITQTVHKTTVPAPHYIGIINEGMTCYMNSMIQSLNAISYFKRGVFSIPHTTNNASLSYSLQRLFFDLTFDKAPTHTNNLIRSLGWKKEDMFIQHDIHEFNLMLSTLMERELKGTANEEVFKYLFEGTVCSKIECVDYKYKSIKEESFTDLQLNVKGCNDIYDSFNKYTETEVLDGSNKYEVEGHDKETAVKSTSFTKMPIVLILQLKRFEYKTQFDTTEKINDHYKYDESIDLSRYISNTNEPSHTYQLLSVLVHTGNVYGGHYYAYVRFDTSTNEWYCFNDELVYKADVFEVFDCNYGGNLSAFKYQDNTNSIVEIQSESNSSAYILIYIKASKANEILKPLTISEIPLNLFKQIYKDKLHEQTQQQIKERETQMIRLYYFNETMIQCYHGLGIGEGFPNKSCLPNKRRSPKGKTLLNSFIRIPQTTTIPQLYNIFKELTGLPVEEMSLFLTIFHKPTKQSKSYFTMHFLNYRTNSSLITTVLEYTSVDKQPKWLVIFIYSAYLTTHQPILQQSECNFTSEIGEHSQDEDAVIIDNNTTVYIPKTNAYVFNTFQHKCTTFNNYTRKLLIYKVINSDNNLDIYTVLCICVDDNGGIEPSSIRDMKLIESEVFDYYMKVNGCSLKQKRFKKTFGLAYFAETSSMVPDVKPYTPNSPEHSYCLSYDKNTFDVNYVDTSMMFLLYDFNRMLYYNKETDCLIILPVLYKERELIGLEKYFININ